jgi:hypothetical protein
MKFAKGDTKFVKAFGKTTVGTENGLMTTRPSKATTDGILQATVL